MSPDARTAPTTGRVTVIGIGPGDPELLTVRACKALRNCDVLLHAGPTDRTGYAYETVAPYLGAGQVVEGAGLVMKRGADDGSVGYDRVALRLGEAARAGLKAGFLTEGDPMLFGSGSYVAERLRVVAPGVAVEVIPAVTSVSAAAARLGWPLAQKDEMLTVCPATYHADEIGAILDRHGTTCWLKAADVLSLLVAALRDRGRLHRAALVEKVGRPDERVFRDLTEALEEDLSYFSLVLVR
ncbi:MAG: precorrin-2 C(20)-methyltransferase [Planctomycetia bacterium]|nr:precorrin-2 C(20)-methyltransferase [Planctomycetia bacterium]